MKHTPYMLKREDITTESGYQPKHKLFSQISAEHHARLLCKLGLSILIFHGHVNGKTFTITFTGIFHTKTSTKKGN